MKLTTYAGAQAGKLVSELRDIYAAAFTAPPFLEPEEQADLFAQEFQSELGAPGFACCVAHDQERAVGFAYGYTAVVGDPPSDWERRLVAAVGPQGAEHWIRGQFAVAWFAVHPAAQGGGIGAQLYDLLLQTTDHPGPGWSPTTWTRPPVASTSTEAGEHSDEAHWAGRAKSDWS